MGIRISMSSFCQVMKFCFEVKTLIAIVLAIFFFFFSLDFIWGKLVSTSPSASTVSFYNYRKTKNSHKITSTLCILISFAFAVNGIWNIIQGSIHLVLENISINILETVIWLQAGLYIRLRSKEWHRKTEKTPLLFYLWCLASFILHVFLMYKDTSRLIENWGFKFKLFVDFLPIPFCLFVPFSTLTDKLCPCPYNSSEIEQPFLDLPKTPILANEITPYAKANTWNILTFSWLNPLLARGYNTTLEEKHVPNVAVEHSSERSFQSFQLNRFSHKAKESRQEPRLLRTIFSSIWKGVMLNALVAATYTCSTYAGPCMINLLVEYLEGIKHFPYEGHALVSAFFAVKMVESFSHRQWFFGAQQLGIQVRSGLTALVYQKALILSNKARRNHTSGEIINYVDVDIDRIQKLTLCVHDIWLFPIQMLLAFLILYRYFGIASVAGLVSMIGVIICNAPFASLQKRYQLKVMEEKDKRMKTTFETLRSMKILKLQAWEGVYLQTLEDLRRVEVSWLKRYLYVTSATVFLFWAAPVVVSAITFLSCILMGIPLTAGNILSALATFSILQDPIYNLPELISLVTQCKVSLKRIANFLKEEELQSDVSETVDSKSTDMAIEIQDGEFSWDAVKSQFRLTQINIRVRKGMKVAICGTVASGKSSLLSGIVGQMVKISGTMKISGTKAYIPQSPWIQSGNIQDNILFGSVMESIKYAAVIQACALEQDLKQFSHGDQTEIGERGVNLSGGQKQRIQLARAIYQDADIYLLDDPFSAVDVHTSTKLFKECLFGILASKTVIYVTHQVEFLPDSDLILVMQDGRIVYAGKYEDLKSSPDFVNEADAHQRSINTINIMLDHEKATVKGMSVFSQTRQEKFQAENSKEQRKLDQECTMQQIIQKEERETGKVKLEIYLYVISAAFKGWLVPFLLGAHIIFLLLQIASNYWIAWATPTEKDHRFKIGYYRVIIIYMCLSLGSTLFVLLRALLLATVTVETAQHLFNRMLRSLIHAPMSFFDSTPISRILNRASADQSKVDLDIPFRLAGLIFAIVQLFATVIIVCQGAWQICITLLPLLSLSIWYHRYYIPSARELARLVGISKAPIIHHFAESLAGAAIIRSFGQEARFFNTNLRLCDNYAKLLFHNDAAMGWFCLRLNVLSNILFFVSLIFMVSMPGGVIKPSLAGLAATYGLNLNVVQAWVVWNLCNVENKMISVERIMQYCNISREAPWAIDSSRPASDWPFVGSVAFENVQVRYADYLPLILKGISCKIPGGSHIGIVGRTGSGKSTLIHAIFRIVEPTEGRIIIDGVDISTIGLHDLRSKLSIIPQDPVLFEASVRSNLDPLHEHTDMEIWEALEKCQLKERLSFSDQKLDTLVMENGENWSMGQRQLVCLGRAFLKRSKILVMDEATASVDNATDSVIQQLIRSEFSDCTVINIAHKIPTVIDSDKVMVMNEGRIVEFDSPSKLLQNEISQLSKLVREFSTRSNDIAG